MLKLFALGGGGEGVKISNKIQTEIVFGQGYGGFVHAKIVADVRVAGGFDAGQRDRFHDSLLKNDSVNYKALRLLLRILSAGCSVTAWLYSWADKSSQTEHKNDKKTRFSDKNALYLRAEVR